jgi:spore germination cell wall hydrolase CwlJ-like protein
MMLAMKRVQRSGWTAFVPQRPGFAGMTAVVALVGSCSTMATPDALSLAAVQIEIPPPSAQAMIDPMAPPLLTGDSALQANAALPIFSSGDAAAPTRIFASATPVARMRALDCLAQAIYYEARSESEDGQRAVAQVVLNRMRHPSWPNSVCGVVYQGPMRPGGGCQFTFTCDGSLARRPYGADWARAQQLASEALAGRVFQPVGLSTFYHANYVMPRWAPRLLKTAVIGAHLFYRLPGMSGSSGAFSSRYAGIEPIARPNPILVRYAADSGTGAPASWIAQSPPTIVEAATITAPRAPLLVQEPVPVAETQIRPEYRQSGQWRTDAPAAITGR